MSDVHKKIYLLPKLMASAYHAYMVSMRNALGYEQSDVAKFRFSVLKHMYEFGYKAALAAFSVKKSTLFDWKRKYEASSKKLSSLVPVSTKPHKTRLMNIDPRLVECIRSIREQYGRVGKMKLKVLLDAYAKSINLNGYGYDKINKIIIRNRYFFDTTKRRYKKRSRLLSPRVKHSPKPTDLGYIEVDSITLWLNGGRHYFITAVDVVSKFAWCKRVMSLTALNSNLALVEFISSYQVKVTDIQTDNGHEFLGEFTQYLLERNINHHFIYPRSPKINGYIERFNRTVKEEFLTRNDNLFIGNISQFENQLKDYLSWYNTKRPHQSLKLLSPEQYIQTII